MVNEKKISLTGIDEKWIFENVGKGDNAAYRIFKRSADIFFGCLGLFLFLLVLPFAAIFIKIDSKGSIVYKQERTGRGDKKFVLYKFRTMHHDNSGQMRLWREKEKSNITRVGEILRRLHLDELPQALNLLKGDISFVGPRAEWSVLAEKFEKEIPFYKHRYLVKPGIVGWAQINFPPSRSAQEAREKFEYDLYYIKNRSALLDVKIILKSYRLFLW